MGPVWCDALRIARHAVEARARSWRTHCKDDLDPLTNVPLGTSGAAAHSHTKERIDVMNDRETLPSTIVASFLLFAGPVFAQGIPQPGDMQQRLEQEMSQTKRATSESAAGARRSSQEMESEAEKKMEDTARQHRSQAEGKMTEEIEKAKRKAQGLDR
jgi:hypothetical protein